MTLRLLTEHHLEFLSLNGGFTGSSESTLVKIPHCWKCHMLQLNSIFSCICKPGYRGSGEDCVEIDLCVEKDNGGCDLQVYHVPIQRGGRGS